MKQIPINKVLRENIRFLRKNLNWSQEFLAEKVGISAPYITQIELGQRSPSLEIIERIAIALGVEYKTLFEPTTESSIYNDSVYDMQLLETKLIEAISDTIHREFFKS